MNTRSHQNNLHQELFDNIPVYDDIENEPTLSQSTLRAFNKRNKMWCDSCRRGFSHQDLDALEGLCPYCQKTCRSQYNSPQLTATPSHPQSSGYISPISRSFNLSLQNRPTATNSQQEDNSDSELFTVTFLRRMTRGTDGSVVSETVIPVVHLATEDSRNRNALRSITNHISRLVRLTRIANRLFQNVQNLNSDRGNDDTDWSSQMDEGHNFSSAINPSQFPFIIFAFGSTSFTESPDLGDIIDNFFSGAMSEGKPPASINSINKLKGFQYGEANQVQVGCDCSVCQSDYKLGDKLVKLPCNHDYHKDCVVQWLKQHDSCPICRRSIESSN